MSMSAEIMRRDFGVRIAKLRSDLNAKDEALKQQAAEKDRIIAENDRTIAEQRQTLVKKDQALDALNLGFKEQAEKIRRLEADIAKLKRDLAAK